MEQHFDKSNLFDMLGIDSESVSVEADDNKYTKKITPPQYLPSRTKPPIGSLFNDEKFRQLKENILKEENITEEEREFLLLAASRHILFNYSLIADYYAHSNAYMQKLMEESALVIIDFEDAIANGYVRLSKEIREILEQSGEVAGDEE